jgi:TolA-binding protein
MNCDDVARNEIAEQYVAGQLPDAEREAYEAHFFECPRCVDELRTLQAIRDDLARRPRKSVAFPWWTAIAAMLALALGAAWWFAAHRQQPPVEVKASPAPNPVSAPAGGPARELQLEALAKVEPLPYTEPRFRGAGEAEMKFRAAMKLYSHNDFAGAVPGLSAASHLDPKASAIRFFLGLSELFAGDAEGAARELEQVASNADALEAADAHYYLGIVRLKQHDAAGALAELRKAIAGQSSKAADAQRLIAAIQQLEGNSRQ